MTTFLDIDMLQELYGRSKTEAVDEDLLDRRTPVSPGIDTLQFLGMLVRWKKPRHIFEFGSGPSTVFLSRLQQRLEIASPLPMMSIDHSQRYLGETRRALGGSTGVHLVHAPLAVTECAGRVFTTYHPAYTREIPEGVRFDFVLIDGPPAYRYGREAPLYHLAPFLADDALIILDDANLEPEQEALRRWASAWPDGFEVLQFPELQKGLAVLRIGDPRRSVQHTALRTRMSSDRDRLVTFKKAEGGVVADGR
jgi:predicted O-methyltransferase YrrM